MAKQVYIFTHIPKCGGRSVYRFFLNVFGEEQVLGLHTRPDLAQKFYKGELDLGRYRAVCGHATFGTEARIDGVEPLYIGLLRDPLERFVSLFNFYRMIELEKDDVLLRQMQQAKSCETAEQYYHQLLQDDDPNWLTSNIQASYITGTRALDAGTVMDAVDRNYHLLMPLENIDLFLGQIAAEIGVTKFGGPRANASDKYFSSTQLSPEFLTLFRRRSDLDYLAYYYLKTKVRAKRTEMAEADRQELRRLRQRRFMFFGWPS